MPREIEIVRTEGDRFCFGNCATIAIAQAFEVSDRAITGGFLQMGASPREGVTTIECRRLMKQLCKPQGRRIYYFTNRTHISLKQWLKRHQKGTYLINQDNHLAYLENGVFKDDWFYSNWRYSHMDKEDVLKLGKFMGWWKIEKLKNYENINNTPPINYSIPAYYEYA